MRTSVKFASVCAGAPIVALWVGGATAWAAPSTSEDSSDATPTQQTNTGGLGISVGDAKPFNIGNATATSSGSSLAIAFRLARRGRQHRHGQRELATSPLRSTAAPPPPMGTETSSSRATTARLSANGNNNDVRAAFGSTNHVTGNDNTSYAIPDSDAEVTGDNNLAVSLCGGSVTISGQSDQQVRARPAWGIN